MLNYDQTICHRVNQCIKSVEESIKTGRLNVSLLSENLHEIRKSATDMENALKMRKQIMAKAQLEDVYQTAKGKRNATTGINNIPDDGTPMNNEFPDYEVIVKNGDKILYQNKGHAGIVGFVEKLDDMDEAGNITGLTHNFFFGRTIGYWYAFDQMRIAIESRGLQIVAGIREMARDSKLVDPEIKKKILGL
jgi:hypothetical protein